MLNGSWYSLYYSRDKMAVILETTLFFVPDSLCFVSGHRLLSEPSMAQFTDAGE